MAQEPEHTETPPNADILELFLMILSFSFRWTRKKGIIGSRSYFLPSASYCSNEAIGFYRYISENGWFVQKILSVLIDLLLEQQQWLRNYFQLLYRKSVDINY